MFHPPFDWIIIIIITKYKGHNIQCTNIVFVVTIAKVMFYHTWFFSEVFIKVPFGFAKWEVPCFSINTF